MGDVCTWRKFQMISNFNHFWATYSTLKFEICQAFELAENRTCFEATVLFVAFKFRTKNYRAFRTVTYSTPRLVSPFFFYSLRYFRDVSATTAPLSTAACGYAAGSAITAVPGPPCIIPNTCAAFSRNRYWFPAGDRPAAVYASGTPQFTVCATARYAARPGRSKNANTPLTHVRGPEPRNRSGEDSRDERRKKKRILFIYCIVSINKYCCISVHGFGVTRRFPANDRRGYEKRF